MFELSCFYFCICCCCCCCYCYRCCCQQGAPSTYLTDKKSGTTTSKHWQAIRYFLFTSVICPFRVLGFPSSTFSFPFPFFAFGVSKEFRLLEVLSMCDLIDILSISDRLRGTVLFMSFSLIRLRLVTGDSPTVSSVLLDLSLSDNLSRNENGLKKAFPFLSSSDVTNLSFPFLEPGVSSTLLLLSESFSLLPELTFSASLSLLLECANGDLSKEIFRILLRFTLDLHSFSSSGVETQLRKETSSSVA